MSDEPGVQDATRRTFLAQERTLLAWWRTGLAALAVAIAFGRLAPALLGVDELPFALLGAGFGAVAIAVFLLGARRDGVLRKALAEGRFEPLAPRTVWVLSVCLAVLSCAAIVLILTAT
jgi:putative membrane protein